MAKYNFFISYSHKDSAVTQDLFTSLTKLGYSVFTDAKLQPGTEWVEVIADAIANSECFIPVITDAFLSSVMARRELEYAVNLSQGRAQAVFPLYFTDQPLPLSLQMILSSCQSFFIRQPEDLQKAIDYIDRAVGYSIKLATLYEKLTEYRSVKHAIKETETLCQLVELLCAHWETQPAAERRKLGMELCRLLDQLENHSCSYGPEAKSLGHQMLGTVNQTGSLLQSGDSDPFLQDIFFSAFAVQLKYLDWQVRTEAVDLWTSGDVLQGIIDPFPIGQYIERQKPYVQAFEAAFAQVKDTLDTDPRFTAEEIAFIRQTPAFELSREKDAIPSYREQAGQVSAKTEDEEILLSVAKFMQEGNKLFDALQKRGIAGDFLKCLLTSYERLKNYCQIVGATDVAADCVDRIVEIRDQLSRQETKPTDNEKAENGIKSLLGLTLHSSGNYDVFISFKNEDADLAEKIYQLCQRHMKVPFWSKRTLPELSKSEYEDAIYDALRKSKHFVVVLSNLEYLNANWIQREMKAFDRAITEGRKPGGNFVIIATDNVYTEILRSNKMCLDERYCGYQILKMSEYEKTLLQYIT